MLPSPNQLSPVLLDELDGQVEIRAVREPEPKMIDASGFTCPRRIVRVVTLVQREGVAAPRGAKEHHLRTIPEAFFKAEDLAIEAQRSLQVSHQQVEVCQAFGFQH